MMAQSKTNSYTHIEPIQNKWIWTLPQVGPEEKKQTSINYTTVLWIPVSSCSSSNFLSIFFHLANTFLPPRCDIQQMLILWAWVQGSCPGVGTWHGLFPFTFHWQGIYWVGFWFEIMAKKAWCSRRHKRAGCLGMFAYVVVFLGDRFITGQFFWWFEDSTRVRFHFHYNYWLRILGMLT